MKALEFQTTDSDIEKNPAFLAACREAIERVAELAPSDGSIRVIIANVGNQIRVKFKMQSSRLRFSYQSLAKSPFMALEAAAKEAQATVRKWSVSRWTQA